MTTPLTPAAQAVRDAAFSAYWTAEEAPNGIGMIAAAALRAAADQVNHHWNGLECVDDLLAIELEGGND